MNLFAAASSETPSTTPSSGTDISQMWDQVVAFFQSNGWNILKFFSILAIGLIAIWIIMLILKRIMRARSVDPMAIRFTAGILRFGLLLILILVLLDVMGVQVTGITTAISAIILAVGVALKDNLANLANGIILVVSKKYKTGDYIIVGDVQGSIVEINFLFTTLKTFDGKQVLMPNSTMVNSQVTNLGAYPMRRVDITFPVAYETDLALAKSVILEVMKSNGKIYMDPAPLIALKQLNSSSLDIFTYCWVDSSDYWDAYYYLMDNVYNEFKRNGIVVPFQQIEIRERKDEVVMPVYKAALPERVEKKREKKKKNFSVEDIEDNPIHVIKTQAKEAQAAAKKAAEKAKKENKKTKKESK